MLVSLVLLMFQKPGHRPMSEIMKVMETSGVFYELKELSAESKPEALLASLFPVINKPLTYPWANKSNGKTVASEYPFRKKEVQLLEKAEKPFKAEDYEAAAKIYLKITKKFPNCYLAWSSLGDTYLFRGKPEEAATYYQKAIELNPFGHRLPFYLGNAYAKMGKKEEAIAQYVRSMTLFPRYEALSQRLRDSASVLGCQFNESNFQPMVKTQWEDGKVIVSFKLGGNKERWMAYAMNKAIWLGPADKKHVWSVVEEKECLTNLLSSYYMSKKEGEASPQLDRLAQVFKDGLFNGFLIYEIASRMDPNMVLYQSKPAQDVLAEYIRRYVIVAK